jgi:hypothetical protein
MTVRVAKIDAAAPVPVVELAVLEAPRCAAISESRLANATEDGIELGIADVESIVVALELLLVIEKERERVVDTSRREMAVFRIGMKAKNARKNCAAALFSRAGTMVWFRVMVIGRPLANASGRLAQSTLLERVLDLAHAPAFAGWYDADVCAAADQRVRGHFIVQHGGRQISFAFPGECEIQIAWEPLPSRAVFELDYVALGMSPDLHL